MPGPYLAEGLYLGSGLIIAEGNSLTTYPRVCGGARCCAPLCPIFLRRMRINTHADSPAIAIAAIIDTTMAAMIPADSWLEPTAPLVSPVGLGADDVPPVVLAAAAAEDAAADDSCANRLKIAVSVGFHRS